MPYSSQWLKHLQGHMCFCYADSKQRAVVSGLFADARHDIIRVQ